MASSRRVSLTKWVNTIAFRLEKIASKYNLDGITAGQLGVYRRVVCCKINQNFVVLVNPTVVKTHNDPQMISYNLEQCVCFNNDRYHIKRPQDIKLSYYDYKLRHCIRDFSGKNTQIIMHLIDHLDHKPISQSGLTSAQMREIGLEPQFIDTDWIPSYRA
jgi:peptide deformylase